MKIYLVEDCPMYEGYEVIAAFADKSDAEKRVDKLQLQRRRWLDKQERLERTGSSEAWATNSPHLYDDLAVREMVLIQHTERDVK